MSSEQNEPPVHTKEDLLLETKERNRLDRSIEHAQVSVAQLYEQSRKPIQSNIPARTYLSERYLAHDSDKYWEELYADQKRYDKIRLNIVRQWNIEFPDNAKLLREFFPAESRPPFSFLQTQQEYQLRSDVLVKLDTTIPTGIGGFADRSERQIRLKTHPDNSRKVDDPLYILLSQDGNANHLLTKMHERQHIETTNMPAEKRRLLSFFPSNHYIDRSNKALDELSTNHTWQAFDELISFNSTMCLGLESYKEYRDIQNKVLVEEFYTNYYGFDFPQEDQNHFTQVSKSIVLLEALGVPPMGLPSFVRMKLASQIDENHKKELTLTPDMLATMLRELCIEKLDQNNYTLSDVDSLIKLTELKKEYASLRFQQIVREALITDVVNNTNKDDWIEISQIPLSEQKSPLDTVYACPISAREWVEISPVPEEGITSQIEFPAHSIVNGIEQVFVITQTIADTMSILTISPTGEAIRRPPTKEEQDHYIELFRKKFPTIKNQ